MLAAHLPVIRYRYSWSLDVPQFERHCFGRCDDIWKLHTVPSQWTVQCGRRVPAGSIGAVAGRREGGAVAASSSPISLASPRGTALSSVPFSCSCERRSIRGRRRTASSMPPSTKTSSCAQRASGSLPACPQEAESSCRSAARAGRTAGPYMLLCTKGGRCWTKSKSWHRLLIVCFVMYPVIL